MVLESGMKSMLLPQHGRGGSASTWSSEIRMLKLRQRDQLPHAPSPAVVTDTKLIFSLELHLLLDEPMQSLSLSSSYTIYIHHDKTKQLSWPRSTFRGQLERCTREQIEGISSYVSSLSLFDCNSSPMR
jgi:hypothetical protein